MPDPRAPAASPSATLALAPGGHAPAMDPERLHQAMSRWRRRSRLIRFWRRALPGLMILISLGVLGLILVRTLGARGPAVQDQAIRMLSPEFFGRDRSGRPYTVTAKDAVRDGLHPDLVALNEPHLVMKSLNGDGPTKVDSATGLYSETTHKLALDGQVRLDDGKGDLVASEHALVDTDAGTVDGRSAVQATGPLGVTTASSYAVKDSGRDISFIGNVKSHLVNK